MADDPHQSVLVLIVQRLHTRGQPTHHVIKRLRSRPMKPQVPPASTAHPRPETEPAAKGLVRLDGGLHQIQLVLSVVRNRSHENQRILTKNQCHQKSTVNTRDSSLDGTRQSSDIRIRPEHASTRLHSRGTDSLRANGPSHESDTHRAGAGRRRILPLCVLPKPPLSAQVSQEPAYNS